MTSPPDEAARGELLLRMMASDAMRGAVERHFGVRLAFQNCHRVAVFRPGPARPGQGRAGPNSPPRAQSLDQRPELTNG
jgi:hypothetical protein